MPNIRDFYKLKRGKARFKLFIRPLQKNMAWIKEIVLMFRIPGSLVEDGFSGTFSVGKTCLLVTKHRRSMRFQVVPSCMNEAVPQLIRLFVGRVLRKLSDIEGNHEFCTSA